MWTWTCSGCGQTFTDAEKAKAEGAFMEHARSAHNPKVILTMDATNRPNGSRDA